MTPTFHLAQGISSLPTTHPHNNSIKASAGAFMSVNIAHCWNAVGVRTVHPPCPHIRERELTFYYLQQAPCPHYQPVSAVSALLLRTRGELAFCAGHPFLEPPPRAVK